MKNSQIQKQKESIRCGDIFRIGNHILANGDARDADLVNKVVGGRKIKMVCNDVPYSVNYAASKRGFGNVKVDKDILNDGTVSESEYSQFTKDWLTAAIPYLERKNSVYIFNSDRMIFALREGMKQAGIKFSQLLVWIKNQPVIGRMDYLPMHELIAYGWYGTHEFKKANDHSVIYCPKPSRSPLHPTQKPVSLLRRLVLNSTSIGDIVYDGFAGSGSLGIACEQTKRSSIMIELDAEYCQTILVRFERLFGIKAQRIPYEKTKR